MSTQKHAIRIAALLLSVVLLAGVIPIPGHALQQDRVDELLEGMPLRDKITQMLMVDFRNWDADLTDSKGATAFTVMNDQVRQVLAKYHFGAVILFAENIQETAQSYTLIREMQEAAISGGGLPMIISADQEGGRVYRLGSGSALPGNMALGATGDANLARIAGRILGSELNALGINNNLAPVVDVNSNANNPVIDLRSYSDDPVLVGSLASACVEGMADYHVIGCAKHFPGHGDTATDSHYGLPVVNKSRTELLKTELMPFQMVVDAGVEMIMTAHILYPQLDSSTKYSPKTGKQESLPATMSTAILTDLLKGEMGFNGIVCTDSMRMAAISSTWDPVQAAVNAIVAGADMLCTPCVLYDLDDLKNLDKIISGIEDAVTDGIIPESRLDDAVTRILKVKEANGILDYNTDDRSLEDALTVVGGSENRDMERQIAAAAVTVVKNEQETLPLRLTPESRVLMLCPAADQRALLVMGWNRAVEAGLVPDGAQMEYLQFSSSAITKTIEQKLQWADTVIVLSALESAAQMSYDHWHTAGPENFVNYAKEYGKTAVVISIDNPYDVQLYDKADAIMAVYGYRGSSADPEALAVSGACSTELAFGPNIVAGIEVALGVMDHGGSLPVHIPRFDNTTDKYTDELVYERGYGLFYENGDIPPADPGGSWGKLLWSITDGTLTITGEGDMNKADGGEVYPWKQYADDIHTVVIAEGVTSVADEAFRDLTAMTSVSLPDSLVRIEMRAFQNTALRAVTLPENVTVATEGLFYDCKALEAVKLGSRVSELQAQCFRGCRALTEITIPASVERIGSGAFRGCESLKKIVFAGSVPAIYSDAFFGVTGQVYYPAENGTWTESVMQDYGGNLTWAAEGAEKLPETVATVPMYRLYNPNSGEHFYTGSTEERDNLTSVGWNYEGVAWNAPVTGAPVYRVFNPNSGDHHYTMDLAEKDWLVSLGWQYEGVAWNSAADTEVPQYRLWNPNADCGSHHYTSSTEERDWLIGLGWIPEGIGWYGSLK